MSTLLDQQVRYLTNADGEPTDVLVPIAVWEYMLENLRDSESGLFLIDEYKPVSNILAELQTSLRQSAAGETYPIEQF